MRLRWLRSGQASGFSAGPARWRFGVIGKWRCRIIRCRSNRRAGDAGGTSLVERGAYLAKAADCMVCHTTKGGKDYAGGLGFKLPFGTLYSTNITSDKETGIGNYSDQDFLNAVHRGIRNDGARLYPAMPYTSYTYMTNADALAIKAYLFNLPPVRAATPVNTLSFPLTSVGGCCSGRQCSTRINVSNPIRRKAPMEQGCLPPKHCAFQRVHTPRNLAFALNNRKKFGGALTAGWRAFNISSEKAKGIGTWRDDELVEYLSTGHARGHGTASGPMGEAVDESFSQLVPQDIRALVTYLRTVPAVASTDLPATLAPPAPASHRDGGNTAAPGKTVFEGACVSCHGWTGESAISPFATLTGAWAVNDPAATNVAQIVISGTGGTRRRALSRCLHSVALTPTRKYRRSRITSPRIQRQGIAAYGA